MENWRKLSQNYHQILLLNKYSESDCEILNKVIKNATAAFEFLLEKKCVIGLITVDHTFNVRNGAKCEG